MNELYQLPDGWEWKKLGDITQLITKGTTPTTNGYKFLDKGINFLKIENIINGEIDISTIEMFISEDAHQSQKRSQLKENDVLFSIAGTIGDTAIVKKEHLPMNTNQAIALIRPKDILNSFFLKYSLLSIISQQTKDKQRGGAIKNISLGDIKELIYPLPPLPEQKRIVAKLDTLFAKIDKAIALHQKNMDEADALMRSVLNEVFGELEEKYEKKPLDEVVNQGGKTISTLDHPNLIYFSLEDIEPHSGKILRYQTVFDAGVKGTAVRFDTECVLYSKLRPYLNKVAISDMEGCSTTELVVLKPKENLQKFFLSYFLRSPKIVNFLHGDSMGAKMPRTNMKTFRKLDVPLPPIETQQKTVAYLDAMSEKIERVKAVQKVKMESLKALKASLLDQAFRGEL